MCRRKGKRVLIGWSVRRPLACCIWHYRSCSCVFLQDTASTLHQERRHHRRNTRHVCSSHTIMIQDEGTRGVELSVSNTPNIDTRLRPISNARADLYARHGYASMVHLISQAQLLWDRRLFPLGHTPTTPCKRLFVHTCRDPNNATFR